ncbi:hypothetical protein HYDPIDRAFT_108862 [Hydnomerulius pinastri MD-312]|nr:hypothetical protein HYDPIDRAFT_108862 [Hydnomerulius pinastri MD-312]
MMLHPQSRSLLPPGFASYAMQMLQNVQHGVSTVELVYTSHEHWPCRPGHTVHASPVLRISVLDSSFNPPTVAHLALAKSQPPPYSIYSTPASTESGLDYDAKLLLLSVRNADKSLKPGDATYIQRLEMMHLLSRDIYPAVSSESEVDSSNNPSRSSGNVAVAIIDEPTFVGKSTALLRFLQTRLAALNNPPNPLTTTANTIRGINIAPSPKLTFLLGIDTLVRLFSPKYYPSEQAMAHGLRVFLSPDGEDCRVVCAHRTSPGTDQTVQEKTMDVAKEFITSKRINLIEIGADEQTYSSSEVRAKVAAGDSRWKGLVTGIIADYIMKKGLYTSCTGCD